MLNCRFEMKEFEKGADLSETDAQCVGAFAQLSSGSQCSLYELGDLERGKRSFGCVCADRENESLVLCSRTIPSYLISSQEVVKVQSLPN